jgi:hypothetical protein
VAGSRLSVCDFESIMTDWFRCRAMPRPTGGTRAAPAFLRSGVATRRLLGSHARTARLAHPPLASPYARSSR